MPRLLLLLRYAWLATPFALLTACGAPPAPPAPAPPAAPTIEHLGHGRFRDVVVVAPASAPAPAAVVLLLSGSDGWNPAAAAWAEKLAARGALVVGIDLPQFQAALAGDGGSCVYPDGDLENLSHFVQAYRHLPTYVSPILAGIGAGGTLAQATLAQAPGGVFSGVLAIGPVPGQTPSPPLCPGPGKPPVAPWIVVADAPADAVAGAKVVGSADWPAAFDALVGSTLAARPAPQPAALADLPIVEVAAVAGSKASDRFAIMLSGDGGWAGLDKDLAAALAAQGIPVAGLDSLRYFWTARTPDGVAADLGRMIGHYSAVWPGRRALLIGYSQGADVLPFAVNRLDPRARAAVAQLVVMGLSPHALFEFHVGNWLRDDDSGPATLPEVNRIAGIPVVCVYGVDESDSLCPSLDPHRVTLIALNGGHHFDGDYAGIARRLLAAPVR